MKNQEYSYSYNPQNLYAILKTTDLYLDIDDEDLTQLQKMHLCKGGRLKKFNQNKNIEQQVNPQLQQQHIIIHGEVQFTQNNKKNVLRSGKDFINRDKIYTVKQGSTLFIINFHILNERLNNLKNIAKRVKLLRTIFPFKSIDRRLLRSICKDVQEFQLSKGELITQNRSDQIFFLLEGACEILIDGIIICDLEYCMCGQQILFEKQQNNVSHKKFQIRVKSAKVKWFSIQKEIIIIKFSAGVLRKLQAIWIQKKQFRQKLMDQKLKKNKSEHQKQLKVFQDNHINRALSRQRVKTDVTDKQLNKFLTIQPINWKRQLIRSRRQNQQVSFQYTQRLHTEYTERKMNESRKTHDRSMNVSTLVPKMSKQQNYKTVNTIKSKNIETNQQMIQPGYRLFGIFKKKSEYLSKTPKKISSLLDIADNIQRRTNILKKFGVQEFCMLQKNPTQDRILKRYRDILETKYKIKRKKKQSNLSFFHS